MPVLINFKICDNAEECYGIDVCPTKAFYWDDNVKTISIDETKCTNCGMCESACSVGAIHVARTSEEYTRIKKEIAEDPRKASDLFVDRYGAQPVHPAYLVTEKEFQVQVLEAAKFTVVEVLNHDSIQCLLHSVPIKDLFKGVDIKYRKLEAKSESLLKKYKVDELPALLFFRDGKLVGRIEGYYDIRKKKWLFEEAGKILKRYAKIIR